MSFEHPRLLVVHFPQCFRFYRDVLQLKPNWGDEADSYASFTQPPYERIVLAIFDRQAMADAVGRGSWPSDAWSQDRCLLTCSYPDVDAEVQRLQQQGVAVELEPADFPGWGIRCAYLRDPDRNLIELSSPMPQDAWSPGLQEAAEKWR
jgi:lactoylglutathione lyase